MRRRRESSAWPLIVAVVAAGALVGAYFAWTQNRAVGPEPLAAGQVVGADAEQAVPAIAHPIAEAPVLEPAAVEAEEGEPPEPLPDSEPAVEPTLAEALAGLLGTLAEADLLLTDDLVNRFVVTVDNLPNTKLARRFVPLAPAPGAFAIAGGLQGHIIGPANAARYARHVALVQALDLPALAALYARHYDAFQSAYVALGYGNAYFNDRLIAVIDHLLATPEVEAPLALVQPGVYHKFADPALEARSAGQKALLRMGSGNAAIVKRRLRELRALLTRTPTQANSGSDQPIYLNLH
jgi:hypothetical protein